MYLRGRKGVRPVFAALDIMAPRSPRRRPFRHGNTLTPPNRRHRPPRTSRSGPTPKEDSMTTTKTIRSLFAAALLLATAVAPAFAQGGAANAPAAPANRPAATTAPNNATNEIGRASCRERV